MIVTGSSQPEEEEEDFPPPPPDISGLTIGEILHFLAVPLSWQNGNKQTNTRKPRTHTRTKVKRKNTGIFFVGFFLIALSKESDISCTSHERPVKFSEWISSFTFSLYF